MEVFYHNLYEFQKGLRNLCLSTVNSDNRQKIEERLKKEKVSYTIHEITERKINIYFGNQECIDIINSFNKINLCELSPEQDFILGTMLGYDRLMQCQRYLKNKYFCCSLTN